MAVEEAGDVGIKVMTHANSDEGIRNAVLAGVASIEHGSRPSDETLQLMAERGTYLSGTDFPASRRSPEAYARAIDRIRRAYSFGVPIVFGTDVVYIRDGWTRGGLTLEFLDSYKDADIPSSYILQMLTMNGADLLGVNSGILKAGLAADIIAVNDNPLADAAALREVHFVMKDGKVYKRNGRFEWDTPRRMNNPRRRPARAPRD